MSQNPELSAYNQLPARRRKFVDAYFECKFNAGQAAIAAGYSENYARENAHKLLQNTTVKQAIEEKLAVIEEQSKLKTSEVVEELRRVAFSNITEALEWTDNKIELKNSSALPPEVSACIASITETPTKHGRKLSIKFHDKVKALELLGRYLNMFTDKVQVDGGQGLGIVLNLGGKPPEAKNDN